MSHSPESIYDTMPALTSQRSDFRLQTSFLVHDSSFHHEGAPSQFRDVARRIAGPRDHVREFARLDRTDSIAPAHDLRCGFRGRQDCGHRRLTEAHAVAELTRVLSV